MDDLTPHVPPSNEQAEMSVLGSCMLSADAMETAGDILHPSDFYRYAHQHIFASALSVSKDGPVDLVTLSNDLRTKGLLGESGGIAYLTTLADIVPSTHNVEYYAEIVRGKSLLRGMIDACNKGIGWCMQELATPSEIVGRVEDSVLKVSDHRYEKMVPISEVMERAMNRVMNGQTGEPFLVNKLTRYTGGGMRPGEYTLLLGYRGQGKTRFMLSEARYWCNQCEPCLIFSLEMSKEQLGLALAAMELNVPIEDMCNDPFGELSTRDMEYASGTVSRWPLYIIDKPRLSISDMLAIARRAKKKYGIQRVYVDYAQKVYAEGKTPYDKLVGVAEGLKFMAKTLDLPVLVLAQLTREGGKPDVNGMADVHAKGAIALEDEAETVLVLERPSIDPKMELSERAMWSGKARVKFTKNRYGVRCGDTIPIGWIENVGVIYDMDEQEEPQYDAN